MRQPKPWFRASKNAWFVEIGGKQFRLAKGQESEKEAFDAFYRLMASQPNHIPKPEQLLVAVLSDLFLDHSQRHNSQTTYDLYKRFLQDFCQKHGRMLATDIKPFHVSRWLDSHPGWKACRRQATMTVKRIFTWAEKEGLLTQNPIRHIVPPRGNRRTRVLTRDEQTEILNAISDEPFREFVTAMLETGCRPSEVSAVTSDHVKLDVGIWLFEQHKTAGKTGKPRVIYLNPTIIELSKKLIAKYPTGPLFRAPRNGKPFTKNNILHRFDRLRKKLPHLKHFVAYNLRHTYATQALVNGVGIAQVAELLGHTSTEMVMKHYGHLDAQVAHMRAAALQATGGNHQSLQ